MRPGLGRDELGVDLHFFAQAAHAAFEQIAHAELLADLLRVDRLALVGEGRAAGDDEAVWQMREVGGQVVGDPVGEIVLLLVAGKILERQHDDRKPRRVGELVVNGSGHETRRQARAPGKAARRKKHESERSRERRPARPDAARLRRRLGRFLRRRRAVAQEVSAHRLGDVLEALRPEVGHLKLEPRLDLPVGVFRQANLARLANPFEPGSDVHAVAHEVAVGFLDDVAKMNADAKLDATFGRQAGVALDHAGLHLERAAHCVDHAAELDDRAVAGALDDAAVMGGDGGIDEVAAKRRKRASIRSSSAPASRL